MSGVLGHGWGLLGFCGCVGAPGGGEGRRPGRGGGRAEPGRPRRGGGCHQPRARRAIVRSTSAVGTGAWRTPVSPWSM
ncbi:hypothetical protein B7C62_23625 [Kitasatospora albolonga]|uniref:Uncharacterized protein n=1 Tax=Kitasatospora albolonga TaxID=68173 RepID=A0ABC8BWW5_9ACTN|nr:hypothetical protein B7C62_23625 [Kitasatospora albolonga]